MSTSIDFHHVKHIFLSGTKTTATATYKTIEVELKDGSKIEITLFADEDSDNLIIQVN